MDLKERILIIKLYYQNGSSASATLRAYKTLKNLHDDPFSLSTISRLVKKFEETGNVLDAPRAGRPSVSHEVISIVEEAVGKCKGESSRGSCSLRQVSAECDLPLSTVYKIMRSQLALRPYKPSFVQELLPGDYEKRIEFANLYRDSIANQSANILWTDEAHFNLQGEVASLSGYVWSRENPHITLEKPLHPQKLTVWCGFTRDFICPPYFFPRGATITADNYSRMLADHVLPFLRKKRVMKKVIYMLDGAAPHYSHVTRDFLSEHFHERIIGRGFQWFWPPRSPDITPCDFWFWGYIKYNVYRSDPQSLDELQQRITEEILGIDVEMLQNVIDSIPRRMENLLEQNGRHLR